MEKSRFFSFRSYYVKCACYMWNKMQCNIKYVFFTAFSIHIFALFWSWYMLHKLSTKALFNYFIEDSIGREYHYVKDEFIQILSVIILQENV